MFKGTHVELDAVAVLRGRGGAGLGRPALHRLRRRRPDRRAAASRCAPSRSRCACSCRRRVHREPRRPRRGGRGAPAPPARRPGAAEPASPAGCSCAWSRAIGRLAARLERGSVVLRHERQDHHGADGRRDPRARGRPASSTTGRARTWHGGIATTLARRAPGAARGRRPRPLRGRRGLARHRSPSSSTRALSSWPTSSATSSTATASSTDRRPLGRAGRAATGRRLRPERRRPARRRPRAGERRADVVYFGSRTAASASRKCSTPPTPSTAGGAERPTATAAYLGHLGHYHCPACGSQRPKPAVAAQRIELDGMSGSRVSDPHPAGGPLELTLPLPGLYNVYNALAATACRLRSGRR